MLKKVLAGAVCCMVVSGVDARVVAPYVGLNIENHSNIKRLENEPIEDTKIAPYAGIVYEDVTGDYESSVNGQITHETFQDDSFDSDTLLKMDAYFDWIVMPGRFTWAVEDYANIFRINVQDRDTPSNRQIVNVFALGPDLLISNEYGDLLLKARYADVSYSETEEDSQRFIGAASLARLINDYSSVHIDSTVSLVDFDAVWGDDYNVFTTGLRYRRDLPYGTLSGSVGYNGFEFDSGKSKNDPYYDLNLSLNIGGGSSLNLTGAYKLTDLALESFNPLYTRLLDDLDINTLFEQTTERGASGIYRVTRGFGSYNYVGDIFSTSFSFYSNEQRYFRFTENDVDEVGAGFSVGYLLSNGLSLYGGGSSADVKYINSPDDLKVDSKRYAISASYNLAENMYLISGVTKENSKSDDPERNYKDTVVYVKFEYRVQPPIDNNN